MSVLSVSNLNHSFGVRDNLKDLSFELSPGEAMTIVGHSGSGKSSLLKCIAGFWRLKSGEIFLGSKKAAGPGVHVPALERRIGYVFQEPCLFPHMTVEKNIRFGFNQQKCRDESFLQHLLNLLGIEDLMQRMPHEVSGGQMQRVALARALVLKPTVLLLDEPFSSLDESFVLDFLPKLRKILRELNVACIYVTHRMQESALIADKVAVMHHGQILQLDVMAEVYRNPRTIEVAKFFGNGFFIGSRKTVACYQTDLGPVDPSLDLDARADSATVFLRPEDLVRDENSAIKAEVEAVEFQGDRFLVKALLNGSRVQLFSSLDDASVQVGQKIGVKLRRKQLPMYV